MLTPDTKTGRYISILSDGKFHESVSKDTEGAVLREYTVKDKEGKETTGSKWELIYSKLEGTITNIEFRDGDYGKQILLTVTDGDDEVIVAQGTSTNFGEDILKKLPSVDFAEKITLQPFAFTSEEGKPVRGVTIMQKGEKLYNFFWDNEAKKPKNGYPELDFNKDEADTDDWKMYYTKARKFMITYATEHILPRFTKSAPADDFSDPVKYPEEINPEDIPF